MLNVIMVKDRKNTRDMIQIQRVTSRIEGIREQTNQLKNEMDNMQQDKNAHVDYLHEYGAQMRQDQRKSIGDAHSKVLEKKIEKFYLRKSDSAINHKYIIQQKKAAEHERLKKCQKIKFQKNLARIRMDCMLKER